MQRRTLPADGQHPSDGNSVRRGRARNRPRLLGQGVCPFRFRRARHLQKFALHVKRQPVPLGVHPFLKIGGHALKPDALQKHAASLDSVQAAGIQELHGVTPNIGRPQVTVPAHHEALSVQHAARHPEAVVGTGRFGPEQVRQHLLGRRSFQRQVGEQQQWPGLRERPAGKRSQRLQGPGFSFAWRTVGDRRHRRRCFKSP